jgi:hypothetical protein
MRGDFEEGRAQLVAALDANAELADLDYYATLLDAFAYLEGMRGAYERALRLFGAAQALLPVVGTVTVPPIRQARGEQWRGAARAALSTEVAAAAEREGRALALEDAVRYAAEPMTSGR